MYGFRMYMVICVQGLRAKLYEYTGWCIGTLCDSVAVQVQEVHGKMRALCVTR